MNFFYLANVTQLNKKFISFTYYSKKSDTNKQSL